jgi:hypothetical protein
MLSAVRGEIAEQGRLDRFVSVAAGPASWRDDRRPSSADLAAGCIELAVLGAILTVSVTAALHRRAEWGSAAATLAVVCLLALVAVVSGPTARWVFGSRRGGDGPRRLGARATAAVRSLAFLVICVLWALVVDGVRVVDAWMFGVVAGCEVDLASRALRVTQSPWRWWRRYLRSLRHLAVAVLARVSAPSPAASIACGSSSRFTRRCRSRCSSP